MFTMGQAAKEVGTSKTSIHRAIKSGKLSASRNDDGTFSIDPAELFRAYPRARPLRSSHGTAEQAVPANETVVTVTDPAVTARIATLEREVYFQAERIAELKEQRDAWQEQAQQAQRLLTATASPATERRGWLTRLFGAQA